jgi:hypothetical protein
METVLIIIIIIIIIIITYLGGSLTGQWPIMEQAQLK